MQTCAEVLPSGYERDANRVENDRIIFLILAMIFALKTSKRIKINKNYFLHNWYVETNFLFIVVKFTLVTIRG